MTADDAAARIREDVRARLAAHVAPTFRHDDDPTPHPDETALVDRLTDAVMPLEVRLRAVLAEREQLERNLAVVNGANEALRAERKQACDERDAACIRAADAEAEREQYAARVTELEAERDARPRPYLTTAIATITPELEAKLRAAFAAKATEAEPCDGDCDCDCQPGQDCLCPERDCYCGPCPVCGPHPAEPDDDAGHSDTPTSPEDAFQAARRRYHHAIAAAHDGPTYAGTITATTAAIDDYNRAVDAYNAAHGLDPATDDLSLGRRRALEHLPSVSEDGEAITHRTEGS